MYSVFAPPDRGSHSKAGTYASCPGPAHAFVAFGFWLSPRRILSPIRVGERKRAGYLIRQILQGHAGRVDDVRLRRARARANAREGMFAIASVHVLMGMAAASRRLLIVAVLNSSQGRSLLRRTIE